MSTGDKANDHPRSHFEEAHNITSHAQRTRHREREREKRALEHTYVTQKTRAQNKRTPPLLSSTDMVPCEPLRALILGRSSSSVVEAEPILLGNPDDCVDDDDDVADIGLRGMGRVA